MISGGMDAPTGEIALAFSDVEGSTAVWDRTPRIMRTALAVHDDVMRATLAARGGYEVKTEGDAFMIAFADPRDAVSWALDAQEALVAAPWPDDLLHQPEASAVTRGGDPIFRGLRVRIGIHTGAPEPRPNPLTGRMDYFGPVVNRAARVAGAAHGGQVLVSDAVSPHARAVGATVTELGLHRLKGLSEPERLHQALPPRLVARTFPDPRTEEVRRTNLTATASPLIGRGAELSRIEALLADGARVVSLVGPAGAGKTRLAREVALRALPRLGGEGGVWWLDLADARNRRDLLAAIAAALEVRLAGETDAADAAHVARAVAARAPLMLVLDNVEQAVADAAAVVAQIAGAAPTAATVVTTRERLAIAGEERVEVTALAPQDAVSLFEARAVGPGPRDANVVAEIAARLDHLPLAIEIAAARTAVLSAPQILARIDRVLELSDARRDRPDRHATLRAAIDWSWRLLDPAEQQALAQCTAFRGGFDLDAAEAVIDTGGDVLDRLQALREKSLLAMDAGSGAPRFFLYESVRAYAREQRDAAAELRHAHHYVDRAEAGLPLTRMATEADNLRAAFERSSSAEPALAVRAALALDRLYAARGPTALGAEILDQALPLAADPVDAARVRIARAVAAARLGDLTGARDGLERAGGAALPPALEAARLAHLGATERKLGERDPDPLLREAVRAADAAGDEHARALALDAIAALYQDRGDVTAARRALADAISAAAAAGDVTTEARLLQNLGAVCHDAADAVEARGHYEQALGLVRSVGETRLEGVVLANLGNLACDRGDLEEARALLDRARRRLGNVGDRHFLGLATMYEGIVALDAGELPRAHALLERALTDHRATHARFAGLDRGYLGIAALLAGDTVGALDILADADRVLAEVGDRPMRAYFAAIAAAAGGATATARDDDAPWVARAIALLGGAEPSPEDDAHLRLAARLRRA